MHRAKNRKVPGWDLAFRAPKSVSILWALGEPEVAREVVAAHESAVAKAVAYLEEEAAFTRTGRNGIRRVKADGLFVVLQRTRVVVFSVTQISALEKEPIGPARIDPSTGSITPSPTPIEGERGAAPQ